MCTVPTWVSPCPLPCGLWLSPRALCPGRAVPGLSPHGPICVSSAGAGCPGGVPVRVFLCPALPGLCPCAETPQLSPLVTPSTDRQGGAEPCPTPQGITRGSAQLCLIRGITWAGLSQGGHPGVPPTRTRHVAAGDSKGSNHGHHVPNTRPQGGFGGRGGHGRRPRFIGVRGGLRRCRCLAAFA